MSIIKYFLALFLFPLPLLAQQVRFEHFTADQGLSQSTINCIAQDRRGFLWVGTENGLNRFDGYRFTHYETQVGDTTSLGNNSIKSILEDREGFIWVGTQDGLYRFDPKTEAFLHFRNDPANPNSIAYNQIHSLYEDKAGGLWIGASLSLEKFDRETGTFAHYPPPYKVVVNAGDLFINQIIEYGNSFYIGTWGEGVLQFDPKKNSFRRVPTNNRRLNGDSWVEQLSVDQDGVLWAVISGYALQYEPGRDTFLLRFGLEPMDFTKTIIAFHKTNAGDFIAGMSGYGLQMFTPDFKTAAHYWPDPDSTYQYNNFITNIYEDLSGEIWLGTLGNGLFKFDPHRKKFGVFPQEANGGQVGNFNDVLGILETTEGEIWTASRSYGIQVFDRENRKFTPIRERANVPDGFKTEQMRCLFQDSRGRIWAGTWGNGLKMFDPKTGHYQQFVKDAGNPNSLSDIFINSICEDKEHQLWIAAHNGLSVIGVDEVEGGVFKNYRPSESGLSHRLATAVYCDHAGTVWVGTNGGLNRFDPASGTFQHFSNNLQDPGSLSNNWVACIFEDRENRLWIGTWGGGLNLFDPGKGQFAHFTTKNGLPTNTLQGIVQDAHGFLWVTTDHGLSKFDPGLGTFSSTYMKGDVPDDCFNARAIGISRLTGEIFAGGVDGFTLFHPDSIRPSPFVPMVAISSLKKYVKNGEQEQAVEVKGISALDRISLPFSENTLTFEFAALNFRQAFKNQYAYKMEGLSGNWTYLGTKREVTLSDIQPGSYTIKVKASNNDGLWNEEGVSLKIIILPPWYRAWWAYLLYALATGSVLYYFSKKEIQSQRLKNRLEIEQMAAEKLKEVDQLKTRLYTNITHEFRTPLTVISGMANLIEKPENSKELIQRNSQRLLRLVNQMLDLAKLESGNLQLELAQADVVPFVQYTTESFQSFASSRNITLVFYPQTSELVMDFDENKLQSIISNLLSNAIKFTPDGGKIILDLKEEQQGTESWLVIKVVDTGTGIAADKLPHIFDRFYQVDNGPTRKGEGTGIGLTLAKELVELMNGNISVKSKPGKGTTFTLKLPAKQETQLANIQKTQPEFENLMATGISSINMEEAQSADSDQPLLLIIEDNADVVTYIHSILKDHYNILVAGNGAIGIEKAFEAIPDIILSDLMMPEKDGFEVTQILKNDERTSHIPIVLLTAKADIESRIEGLQRGADAYLAKPFEKKELMVRLEKLIELRTKLQARYAGSQLFTTPADAEPPDNPESIADENLQIEDAFLLKIRHIMEGRFRETEFTVTQLCHEVGMSQPQLYRKVKALTGQSIVAWMKSFRLHKAKALLENSPMSISEIGYNVGFSDPAYFSRAFSEEFGVPPMDFRK
ncbi:MAG: response regulator [Saprospiraceae bacterium]|nr:response regulator [Saprospiraceae bacterium]